MFKLKCGVQNYSWGKKGCDSIVARIYEHNGGTIDPNLSYAEYWMGSHPNCPSKLQIKTEEMFLLDYLKNSSNTEGLKFLFKVLSIKDPLSIQIHPDKVYAEFLAKDEPEHYKDPNHKPEMAIAISDEFKLLYGFLPIDSALEIMTNLKEIFTKHANDNLHSTLSNFLNYKTKSCYLQLIIEFLNISNEIIRNLIDDLLVKDITNIGLLYSKFGYDKGILVSLLMNVYTLKKGDTIFIRPNVPHAYIEGDCLECMANSDNVIRLGLTPKYVDIKNFIKVKHTSLTVRSQS